MRKIKYVIIFIISLLSPIYGIPAKKLAVAIISTSINSPDITQSAIISIFETVYHELFKRQMFNLVDPEITEKALSQIQLGESPAGSKCSDARCLTSLGYIVHAQRIVTVTITKTAYYSLFLKVFDVTTGITQCAESKFPIPSIEECQNDSAGKAVEDLVECINQETEKPVISNKKGWLTLLIAQRGTTIEIDGNKIPETLHSQKQDELGKINSDTFYRLTKTMPTGMHRIVIRKNGYSSKDTTVNIPEKEVVNVNVNLEYEKGFLIVVTSPQEASLMVDGKEVKKPSQKMTLPIGKHTLTVAKQGYFPQSDTVVIENDSMITHDIYLKPAAYITVDPGLPSSRIIINDKDTGVGSVQMRAVAVGKIKIKVDVTDYEPWDTTLNVNQGDIISLHHKPTSIYKKLQITTKPKGAEVFLSGKPFGKAPCMISQLRPGSYPLELKLASYNNVKDTISIDKNIASKTYTLHHIEQEQRIPWPGIFKVTLGVTGLAAGAGAANYFIKMHNTGAIYQNETDAVKQSESKKRFFSNRKMGIGFAIASSICLPATAILYIKDKRKSPQSLALYYSPAGNGEIGMAIPF
jgi:hypothetical protein